MQTSKPLSIQDPATRPVRRNTSGFPGVHKAENKWKAYLKINGKRVHLGRALTPLEAYRLRVRAAQDRGITLPEKDYFIRRIQAG